MVIMSKLLDSIEQAIDACELRDGMTVSFHHHLRNGDQITSMVLNAIARKGITGLKLAHSSIMDGMTRDGMIDMVRQGVIAEVDTNGSSTVIGGLVTTGAFSTVVRYRTHGGRAKAITSGELAIDVAFVAAPAADALGNCNGIVGPRACGSLGYPMDDARHARKTVVITDTLMPYPLQQVTIDETVVDYVVAVDCIGDPAGIATGVLAAPRDPLALILAENASQAILHSGLFKEGFSFQAGASGPAIATTRNVHAMMQKHKVHGSFLLGGSTSYSVAMLEDGLFDTLLDVQCFDTKAVASLRDNSRHQEISASRYANPEMKSCAVNQLDVVILGALQVDSNFDVNVHMESTGYFTSGSGGHGDTAQGAAMTVIVAPLTRSRFPTFVPKVLCRSTPGENIDVVATQFGLTVNPRRADLHVRFKEAGLKMMPMEELVDMAEKITGKPAPLHRGDRIVAEIMHRDGLVLDRIPQLLPKK